MKNVGWLLAASLILFAGGRTAIGQFVPSVGGGITSSDSSGASPAGTGIGGLGRLAQQPGLVPGGRGLGLAPGETQRLALYCADLFARTPDHRARFTVPGDGGVVRLGTGVKLSLRDAIEEDLLRIRGRGPTDPSRMDGRAWIDLYVTNPGPHPLWVELPAGLLLVPAGQPVPKLPDGFDRLVATAAATRRHEGQALAYAVWAARGSTRADVEQTAMLRVTDAEARQVQGWLDAAGLPYRFDRDVESYHRLYEQSASALKGGTSFAGTASLSTGARVQVEGTQAPDGHALVTLRSLRNGTEWRYRAQIDGLRPGRVGLALRHLKTDLPIEANGGRVWVTLASR